MIDIVKDPRLAVITGGPGAHKAAVLELAGLPAELFEDVGTTWDAELPECCVLALTQAGRAEWLEELNGWKNDIPPRGKDFIPYGRRLPQAYGS